MAVVLVDLVALVGGALVLRRASSGTELAAGPGPSGVPTTQEASYDPGS
ncbi:MAG TPA: hypothetical protein VD931_05780 [Baekduia sp.]|nr:hypothetical protein [Baekduia sp.]